jgi:hypothetical protein
MGCPLRRHWYVIGAVPVADTEKLAPSPSVTATAAGCEVIVGATGAGGAGGGGVAGDDPPPPPPHAVKLISAAQKIAAREHAHRINSLLLVSLTKSREQESMQTSLAQSGDYFRRPQPLVEHDR